MAGMTIDFQSPKTISSLPRLSPMALPARNVLQSPEQNSETSETRTISTPLTQETGSFGNMFDVKALKNDLQIIGLDFYTDLIEEVTFEVWTKVGTFQGAEDKPDQWSLLSLGSLMGAGRKEYTVIPFYRFTPVHITNNTIQAFYVTLTTPDIRYSFGKEVGAVNVSNADIQIMEGSGIIEYPFGLDTIYVSPRTWHGALHYFIRKSLKTKTTYKFEVEYPSTFDVNSSVLKRIDLSIKNTLDEIIGYGGIFVECMDKEIRFSLDSVETKIVDDDKCIPKYNGNRCSVAESIVSVSHTTMTKREEVKFALLFFSNTVVKEFPFFLLNATYIGVISLCTRTVVTLIGNDMDLIPSDNIAVFEDTATNFLNEAKNPLFLTATLNITSFSVIDQVFRTSVEPSSRTRHHTRLNSQEVHVDVTAVVTGEYTPPPDINLQEVVYDSFNKKGDILLSQLKKKKEYFETVREIVVLEKSAPSPSPSQTLITPNLFMSFGAIAVYASVTVFLLLAICIYRVVATKKKYNLVNDGTQGENHQGARGSNAGRVSNRATSRRKLSLDHFMGSKRNHNPQSIRNNHEANDQTGKMPKWKSSRVLNGARIPNNHDVNAQNDRMPQLQSSRVLQREPSSRVLQRESSSRVLQRESSSRNIQRESSSRNLQRASSSRSLERESSSRNLQRASSSRSLERESSSIALQREYSKSDAIDPKSKSVRWEYDSHVPSISDRRLS